VAARVQGVDRVALDVAVPIPGLRDGHDARQAVPRQEPADGRVVVAGSEVDETSLVVLLLAAETEGGSGAPRLGSGASERLPLPAVAEGAGPIHQQAGVLGVRRHWPGRQVKYAMMPNPCILAWATNRLRLSK